MGSRTMWGLLGGVAATAVLLGPVAAFAQAAPAPMRGKDIIWEIFGVDASTLASAASTGQSATSILASVSGVINAVALFAAVFVLLLTFIHAISAQGEHGKLMGRYSTVWVPIRAVMAMGLLAPLSVGGYSLVQVLILWVGLVGSNYADEAWTAGNTYMSQNMSLSQATPPPEMRSIIAGMYQMEMCAAAIERVAATSGGEFGVQLAGDLGNYRSQDSGGFLGLFQSTDLQHTVRYNGTGSLAAAGAVCGEMTIERSGGDASAEATMGLQITNTERLRTGLGQLARAHLAGQLTGGQVAAALRVEEQAYVRNEHLRERIFAASLNANGARVTQERQAQLARGERDGWTSAGAYYMTMVGLSGGLMSQITAQPRFVPPRLDQLSPSVREDLAPMIARAGAMGGTTDLGVPGGDAGGPASDSGSSWFSGDARLDLLCPACSVAMHASTFNFGGALDAAKAWMREKILGVVNSIPGYVLEGDQDPVVRLSSLGHYIMGIVSGAVVVVVAIAIKLSAVSVVGGFMLISAVMPFILPFALAGVFLAYFLPGMPYFMWMMGVAGWMLMLVQAVVAGPLWAAAHTMPEGEGFAGQHARQGYMLLVSLLARPLLMVVGLIAAMLVVRVAIKLVATTFGYFADGMTTDTAAGGLVGLVALVLIFAALCLVLVRWSFSLIHIVPDSVLRFIGAVSESLGEANVSDNIKTAALAIWATSRGGGGAMRGASDAWKHTDNVAKEKGARAARVVTARGG